MTFNDYFLKESGQLQGSVKQWLSTNGYVVHATDSIERLVSILQNGLNPGTQMSRSEGQGLESGPYVLVYPGKAVIGRSVDYRPGDMTHTKTRGKPVAIIFDDGHFCDKPTIKELEAKHERLLAAYEAAKGTPKEDRAYRAWINVSDEYFDALENPNYQPACGDDYFKEMVNAVHRFNIPTYKMDYNDELDGFVFKESYTKIGKLTEDNEEQFDAHFQELMRKREYFFAHPEEFPAPPENEVSKQFEKDDIVQVLMDVADMPDRWGDEYLARNRDKLPKKGATGIVIGKRADGPTPEEVQVLIDFTKGTGGPISLSANYLKVVYRP